MQPVMLNMNTKNAFDTYIMRKLSLLITMLFFALACIHAEKSPHGDKLKIDCAVCHVTTQWKSIKQGGFNHTKTKFPLTGEHKTVNCKRCHGTLNFTDAKTECQSCHNDMHQGTVGKDCQRCHTTSSWLVKNVRQLHQQRGFVLMGAHASADCDRCHTSASRLRFENINSECVSCHRNKYLETVGGRVDHIALGFDTDCARCHSQKGFDWSQTGKGFDHSFFPLTGGHAIGNRTFGNDECYTCHTNWEFNTKLSPRCTSCHSASSDNPNPAHQGEWKKYECDVCHTIQSFIPAKKMTQHDSWFKIYSGEHKGEWDKCTDCHNNPTQANCRKCHDFDHKR